MLNSRDISQLRFDVAYNCRQFIKECEKEGLPVCITGTVRDTEYQMKCYREGHSRAKVPSFHSVEAGLAFDFCKNVKGHAYDDTSFFNKCGAIAKRMGFSWAGDWKSFKELCHIQWDAGETYTSAMVRAGKYPPMMTPWKEVTLVDCSDDRSNLPESEWSVQNGGFKKATEMGVVDGTAPQGYVTREQLCTVLNRLGLLK